jgi:hypothetical protein
MFQGVLGGYLRRVNIGDFWGVEKREGLEPI